MAKALDDVADVTLVDPTEAFVHNEVVAANIRALIEDGGELASWQTFPPLIAIPLGPDGGAGFLGDGVPDRATIAEVKGRDMLVERYAALRRAAQGGRPRRLPRLGQTLRLDRPHNAGSWRSRPSARSTSAAASSSRRA